MITRDEIPKGSDIHQETPNDVKTKRNKTMLEQIRGNNLGCNPDTSYGRTMVA